MLGLHKKSEGGERSSCSDGRILGPARKAEAGLIDSAYSMNKLSTGSLDLIGLSIGGADG